MRSIVVGIVMAVALVAGLFALAKYDPPLHVSMLPTDVASQIEPGFVGAKQIGPWILVCPAKPAAAAATGPNAFGRCRTTLIYHRKENPKQVVLAISFRLVGADKRVAAIVVMPPLVKKGDELDLRAGRKLLKLPISVCDKTRCIAVVALARNAETELLSERYGVLVFPASANGKRGGVAVPFYGLQPSVDAMRRAES